MDMWRFASMAADLGAEIEGVYNLPLVVLSFVVASLAGYAGLEFAQHLSAARSTAGSSRSIAWLAAGAVAIGSGIWSMHFIGMLAFTLPVPVTYDPLITLVSGLPAVLAAAAALQILRRPGTDRRRLVAGGLAVAVGIGAMHYLGMEAMGVEGTMTYDPLLFGVSIVVAVVLAISTFYVKFALGARTGWSQTSIRVGSAVVFGLAVCGMHYTAMTAVHFFVLDTTALGVGGSADSTRLAVFIGAAAGVVLALAIGATIVSRRLERAAVSVRRLEERTRLVLSAVGEGIIGVDGDARITFVNPAGAAMLGSEPEGLVGRPLHGAVHSSGSAAASCKLCQVDAEVHRSRDDSFRRVGGDRFPVAATRTPLINDDVLVGAVVVFSDITQQQEVERELIAALDAADAAALAKSAFLANMSHEIRTPMNGVLGMAQILAATRLTSEQTECVDALLTSGESLMTIINDVLDFSKIEAGKLRISPYPFELRQLIASVSTTVQPSADDKGIRLLTRIDEGVPGVLVGDSHRLRQVLLNLIGNAIKFTESGEVEVDVRCRNAETGVATVAIAVRDSGIGIAPDAQARLFQPFNQADSSTTRRFGGTGLGLAVCRQLVSLMGGEIGLRSKSGVGSTFWFELDLPVAEKTVDVGRQGPASSREPHGCRVLVVEDNRINQMVARRMLEQFGCTVEVAKDGNEGLKRASSEDFDLIVMDCYMPIMDGFESTRQIRAAEGDTRVPIIAMTASVLPADRDLCYAAGMDDYVAKPVDRAELSAMLDKWLPASRSHAA